MVRACIGKASAVAASSGGGKSAAAPRRVLVLGGTGRAGGATATALSDLRPDLSILVAGRNREKGTKLVSKLGERSEFVQLDIHNARRLEAVMESVDLVVHAAGPFQREDKCAVMQAAISTKTGYADVCDGMDYSWRAKSLHEEAKAAGVPALITAGISPGVSNVMAAELVRAAKSENCGEPERLRFFYYIAGTGGAGPTALGTSFLLLGEDVIAYHKGREIKLKPYSGARNIDFGEGIGKKDVYLLNLPEVKSTHKFLGVPTVSARFGSDPFIWNWGMETFANFLPADILRDKNIVLKLTECVDPFIRVIDGIVGECVSMRIDLENSNGHNTMGLFTHNSLSVGLCSSCICSSNSRRQH
ncbi:uncharacterized protein LOC106866586 isoform X2 [Brachypodium distachyon]|uniref:Saccharopine dehydrogenase NADP binding domain-containing protein n=1 Tax=Brachypodium distachyon TaxID=15368 RepID=A0A0Q3HVT2_BRADI|nr:uncharacterized protein LOC106866586 isoform X2 [Brachypodium distachyon]KQJ92379.1 hypothetical protein BRADI_4g43257v3 [Brachypodium distachyon]PNT65493.1 hypothetical protein BRADI_4g43257v3 [Brachypodium distachyon]|eukprot:XP_024310706.1 uncharacterized protein LOC106866586 isoform X2 [Brachypodium distachyon]